jgi:hypothetical protein
MYTDKYDLHLYLASRVKVLLGLIEAVKALVRFYYYATVGWLVGVGGPSQGAAQAAKFIAILAPFRNPMSGVRVRRLGPKFRTVLSRTKLLASLATNYSQSPLAIHY